MMLVDIDLLPKRKSRNITTPLVYGICAFFLLFVAIILLTFTNMVKNDVQTAEQDLEMVQQLRIAKEEAMNRPQNSSSAQRLEDTVVWAEEYPLEMVPVMQDLIRLLPERGFIQSFTYDETGLLNLSVQFDESRDAAYFLYHLNESPLYHSIDLSSISTVDVGTEETVGVLPRYIGQYTLGFDRNAFQAVDEEEAEEEDGTVTEEEEDEEL
ncbi:PilN domain-containing protein [Bacillus sp. LL01]|uniref:PilN domain-containing protein n=1 Tax=Bacillus sp. LL01 TaxID=1665556 RepID=UPI000FFF412A|nr:PilN domain-containing protein [Bacillus sp. LL01]